VEFLSYLTGLEIQTEFPVPPLRFGVNTGGRRVGLAWTFHLIADTLGGWVKIGGPLPPNYTPPPQFANWLLQGKPYIYRDNREILLTLLGNDTIQPTSEARKERETNEIAVEIITSLLSGSYPRISYSEICKQHRSLGEVFQAISFITGFEVQLEHPLSKFLLKVPAFSPSCEMVSIPALLRFYASAFNATIRIGNAVPVIPREAVPLWVLDAGAGKVYQYKERKEWIQVLGGEKIQPDSRWVPLFQDERKQLLEDISSASKEILQGKGGSSKLNRGNEVVDYY